MPSRLLVSLLIALSASGWVTDRAHAADASPPRKIRMAFTSLSSVMCPPWIAREGGIFNKHGLEVEVIATPTGVKGMNAMIAGEVQFLQISGGTTASAALGGRRRNGGRHHSRCSRTKFDGAPDGLYR